MDENKGIFQQLILSNFKIKSATESRTLNNYSMIMTNITDNKEYVGNFWVNPKGYLGEFHVFSEYFEDLKNLTLIILNENLTCELFLT